MSATAPVKRRCGYRIEGGIYIEIPLSRYGRPLAEFLLDPAIPVGPEYGIPERGMVLRDGVLFDRIGGDYPNVVDWLHETATLGLSRRIQGNFDFSKLDADTKYAVVHPRGWVNHEPALRRQVVEDKANTPDGLPMKAEWLCPKHIHTAEHGIADGSPCSGAWWNDYEGKYDDDYRIRSVGDNGRVYYRPRDIEPSYQQAIIAVFRIPQLTVIKARNGRSHLEPLAKAERVGPGIDVVVSDY